METETIRLTVPLGYGARARDYAAEAVQIAYREDLQRELIDGNQPVINEMLAEARAVMENTDG
jgi:hypothetical protein